MDAKLLFQFVGNAGVPSALLFIIVLKMIPAINKFTEQLFMLTTEVQNLVIHLDGSMLTKPRKHRK